MHTFLKRLRAHLALLVVSFVLLLGCDQGVPQQSDLCAEAPAPDAASVGQVAWPGALYWPQAGAAWPAHVLSIAPDGTAELLLAGYADAPGAGHPTATTVAVPCLRWTGSAALERPQDAAWVWPSADPAAARPGALAGITDAGLLRVVIGGTKVQVLELKRLQEPTKFPAYVLDPSTPLVGDSATTWAAACRSGGAP
jgi:hypothetical protein